MSAFIVAKKHIDALIRCALVYSRSGPWSYYHEGEFFQVIHETADQVGTMLITENIKSVGYRYDEPSHSAELPGPISAYWLEEYSYPLYGGRNPTPVEGLKLIQCYDYQACEHEEWPTSQAHAFCQALTHTLIAALPGYAEAPWEWR